MKQSAAPDRAIGNMNCWQIAHPAAHDVQPVKFPQKGLLL